MAFKGVGVDFGHNQGAAVVHAPCGRVVHHHATSVGRVRGEFLRSAAAGGKNGQINALKDIFFKLLHGKLFVTKRHFSARRPGRRKSADFGGGKVPFVQGLEHFTAYGACGAYNGYSQLLAHGISLSLGDGRWLMPPKR